MIRHEESKSDLLSWLYFILKILIIFLITASILSFLYYQVGFGLWSWFKNLFWSPLSWFSWKQPKPEKPCEIIKYVKETDKDLEEFKKV